MTNGQIRDLCIALLHAETEDEVIELLTKHGYWDKPELWRHYGDLENNWGQGGNQQSLAEAALVEKIVNSVDARLINECLVNGVDPKGPDAPKTIREAVARFFESGTGKKLATGGLVEDWNDEKIREVAQGITLCGTGTRPVMNLTIADCGEGQTPRKIPLTIMSLSKSNKMYIPFVQGQFNQGGTGALRFCGKHNMQLVVSRRNPKLLGSDPDDGDKNWGFTVVRRERPEGGRKNSILSYLAPVGVGTEHPDRKGDILSFASPSMKIFPDKESPYGRESTYGTAIKLYDYKYLGERSNIIRGRSILSRLDLLLPEIALPIRLYEFRKNAQGKYLDPGSRETSLSGLRRRLNNTTNVEEGFPIRIPFSPSGEPLFATVYAFKQAGTARDDDEEDEAETKKKKLGGLTRYRKREGVLFVRNGQTQGTLPKDFFRRDTMKLKTIADDLLVFVECDQMGDENREDLFMPSRDRLTENDFKVELIEVLEQTLRNDDTLRQLRNQRQKEMMSDKLKDDKPLADKLQNLIKSSPNLTALLQLGQRITAPFNANPTGTQEEKPFKGEVYPTFFKAKGTSYGEPHKRDCPINYRMRLTFETDARDDYFSRRIEAGKFSIIWIDKTGTEHKVSIVGPNLRSGSASVMVTLPEGVNVGDILSMVAVTEDSRATFKNKIEVNVRPWAEHHKGGGTKKKDKNPDNKKGDERERPRQLSTPKMDPVYRDRWEKFKFDEYTAMKMDTEYDEADNEISVFRINMDNTPLLNEIKQRRLNDENARNQFMYGNVLVGLALLLQDKDKGEPGADAPPQEKVEDRIYAMCRALAPFMLSLTTLGQEDLSDGEQIDGLEAATG
ncbi:hypothetical protein [Bradyrhizobium japonicum]|uniref:hypothetical protein n=1 Tax=Bradyrhizobium japonicum TaxID=375 RepID=UPI001E34CFFB|nr:hypothetical protein [Bradyrhizobium japonicum]MCD9816649.1 hypothetical protein [Bradyrhizobium japonicum]MEB2670310.1 hypothetical protein [Bradyrhizobium japonicum]WRI89661.1 hypothetical protein R3F75_01490 [Bradyrhizobium japonicum]